MTATERHEDRLYDDPALVQFYDLENAWGPDFDLCARLAAEARSVLDLGCGTISYHKSCGEKVHLNYSIRH